MNNASEINMRRASLEDGEFAFQVKKAAFQKYIELIWGWDETLQRDLHERMFAEKEFWVIRKAEADIGILALARGADRIDVNQLFLLPYYQRQGIGFACMKEILIEAKYNSLPVYIQTLKVNLPAQAFAAKLGFQRSGETETHIQWKWNE